MSVCEDEFVFAFLDIAPLSPGHTLVIPKEPAATLDALSDEASAALGRVLPRLCRAIMKATGAHEYNVLQNNGPGAHQAVLHVHFHIIQKPDESLGLGIEWQPKTMPETEQAHLAQLVRSELGKN